MGSNGLPPKPVSVELVGGPVCGKVYHVRDKYVRSLNLPCAQALLSLVEHGQPYRPRYVVYRVREECGLPVVSQSGHVLFDFAGVES